MEARVHAFKGREDSGKRLDWPCMWHSRSAKAGYARELKSASCYLIRIWRGDKQQYDLISLLARRNKFGLRDTVAAETKCYFCAISLNRSCVLNMEAMRLSVTLVTTQKTSRPYSSQDHIRHKYLIDIYTLPNQIKDNTK
jgi:hypothetical protein